MLRWIVVQDRSGWHKSMPLGESVRPTEVVVDEADDYFKACKLADQLNQISEVQDG